MITHALVLGGPMAAPCASQAVTQSPQWLQLVQAIGSSATTIGVLIALYIAIIREPREASEVHWHHEAQMHSTASERNVPRLKPGRSCPHVRERRYLVTRRGRSESTTHPTH